MNDGNERRAELDAELDTVNKRDLLTRLLSSGMAPTMTNLSPEQSRLWLLRQLDDTVPWHVHTVTKVYGRLDLAALQQALADVTQRHDVLRATVEEVNGVPMCVSKDAMSLPLPQLEIEPSLVDDAVMHEVSRQFNVRTGPLVRATLLRSSPTEHVLVLVAHQMVADSRSVELLTEELFRRYAAFVGGAGDVEVTESGVDFATYTAAQRQWLAGEPARHSVAEWRRWLTDVPSLRVATDRPRPISKTFRGVRLSVPLDPALSGALARFAKRFDATEDATLLAAFLLLLSRCSDQDDFAIGTPVSGRWDAASRGTIGPLESVSPLRFTMPTGESFTSWVGTVAAAMARGCQHERVPFETIVEAVDPPRELSQTPICQASYTPCPAPPPLPEVPEAVLDSAYVDTGFLTYDLELSSRRVGDTHVLTMSGNTDLFDGGTVRAMLDRLVLLLDTAVAEPESVVGTLPMITNAERELATGTWNRTRDDHSRDICFHEFVEAQAAATPTKLAVRCGSEDVTYQQLVARAAQLGRALRQLGVGPDSRVAVVTDRSAEAVVALLGVLMAGGAYVPIAPNAPVDRTRFVLADAGVTAAVESRAVAGSIARAEADIPVLTVPADAEPDLETSLGSGVGAHNLAYLIYTSGSTGQPKGVAVEHRQLVASTAARWAYEDPIVDLLTLPLTFDAAAGGLHWTLSKGGTVVIPTEEEAHDPRLMGALVRRQPVTHINSMHAHYKLILDATNPEDLASLRYVDVGGEPLPPTLVGEHYRRTPDALLCNCYGPTETTVWATTYECRPEDAAGRSIPIGRPVRNTTVYVLDEHLEIVGPGIPGELCIGGEGVARGYLNAPRGTAQRFVPDPFADQPGARMYRTGDRARYRSDGTIEFLGRNDDQVKIRGFRVELGEIEKAVAEHEGVARSVVVLHDDGLIRRLIGYVSCVDGVSVEPTQLRDHTIRKVPDYMVPSSFVVLDRIPVTSSGKVDRKALPSPASLGADQLHVQPRTATEDVVAKLIADLLGVESVSATADFFEMGGDSLLLARLMNQLSRRYEVRVPLEHIFRVPTVAGIAYAIENQQRAGDDSDADAMLARQMGALRAELELDPAISPDGLPHADWFQPKNVVVTGATGYIGAFLVAELLRRTEATVHCLVRASGVDAGFERIENVMREYHVWDEAFRDRIRAVPGDLGLPKVGLSQTTFDEFATSIDAIYHSGATVNFVYSYDALRAPNVEGTVELLRLATTKTLKAFHHVSTMDVWIGTHAERPFLEVELPERPKLIPTSYARSKWVSEKLVSRASDRGIPVCVYRPWLAMGDQKTGAAHTTDYLLVALKGFLQIGVLPSYNDVVNAIPADFLAESITHISLQSDSFRRVYFHLGNRNPASMMQIYGWVHSFGYDVPLIDYEDARHRALEVGTDNPLFPLAPILGAATRERPALQAETYAKVDVSAEYRNFSAMTAGTGITCPPLDEEYVHRTLRFLVERGYLPAPALASIR